MIQDAPENMFKKKQKLLGFNINYYVVLCINGVSPLRVIFTLSSPTIIHS